MRIFLYVRYSLFLFLSLASTLSFSQQRDSYAFEVSKGEVIVTPARCPIDACIPTNATLTGSFVGFLPSDASQLFFTSSSIKTQPDVSFELPTAPNEDSNGVSREATFVFDGKTIIVKGKVDSRAFDGPLVEYRFSAEVVSKPSSDVGFYTARPDMRKCVSPLCGGYFVKEVNKKHTQCVDGTKQRECYVAELSYPIQLQPILGISITTPLFLVGKIVPKAYEGFGQLGVFIANGTYEAATENVARGKFYGAENNGIMCITAPCFSYDLAILNKNNEIAISQINFEKSGADVKKIDQAREQLANGKTLYASGRTKKYDGFSGTGVEFVVHQFYLPIAPLVNCEEGYTFDDGACRTPYGCIYPNIQLNGYGGAQMVDPTTGDVSSTITQSCVKYCEFPGEMSEPGQCNVYYP